MSGGVGQRAPVGGSPARVEHIAADGVEFALVFRAGPPAPGPHFLTPAHAALQVGILAHGRETSIARHFHRPIKRRLVGTAEVLIVQSGCCALDIYDGEKLVATSELTPGDIALLLAGGHGLRMLEDTVLIEVKQGPYLGLDEKFRY